MAKKDTPGGGPRKPWVNHLQRLHAAGLGLGGRDMPAERVDAATINDLSREELNAKFETIEIKMDARVEAIASKIDGFLGAQTERDKRLDDSIADVRRDIVRLGNLKLNIWGATLTAVALGVAVAALSVTLYQTGKGDIAILPQSSPTIQPPALGHATPDA
ncbi:hypothetical protein P5705_01170 [Pseudomonas entomophila]|uniref:hypothetical protein n=1 Tax=Pseudomonas entomophila TaxID=312306 RepID=UPI00240775B6|nr:hypothetical protein [Pseudomonas entomophila]MDF9616241.1 hypothetical protein [Pseudomonas entomophila]